MDDASESRFDLSFTLSHSSLISCTSYFLSVYVLSESLVLKPRRNYLGTESSGMRNFWLGRGRDGIGESWL